jgi:ribosomal protein S18 acetylase RimI-like enzyme
MTVRIHPSADDTVLAEHYHRHWLELGIPAEEIAPDWHAAFLAFVRSARDERAFAGFVARDESTVLGSACCQLVERVYPAFRLVDRGGTGYVWSVYVHPAARGQGLGRQLVQACVAHLQAQGCGRVLLHTGPRARPLYERLGFAATDELALRIDAGARAGPTRIVPSPR